MDRRKKFVWQIKPFSLSKCDEFTPFARQPAWLARHRHPLGNVFVAFVFYGFPRPVNGL